MKKLVILMLCLLASINISAQIQRNIWGCVLGSTQKQAVLQKLKSKGLRVKKDNQAGQNTYTIEGNINFGGQQWTVAYADFHKNTLMAISFYRYENMYNTKNSLDLTYSSLSSALDGKYAQYKDDDIYNDGVTKIVLSCGDEGYGYNVGLMYINIKTLEKSIDANDAEL